MTIWSDLSTLGPTIQYFKQFYMEYSFVVFTYGFILLVFSLFQLWLKAD